VTTQIAVRLPDPLVEYLDREVAEGRAPSRAALVTSAIEREMRRHLAERDAQILAEAQIADDLDGLVDWTVRNVQTED
jgi:Arc/MetJ-type ribon-helix-helix transcriptional regulator